MAESFNEGGADKENPAAEQWKDLDKATDYVEGDLGVVSDDVEGDFLPNAPTAPAEEPKEDLSRIPTAPAEEPKEDLSRIPTAPAEEPKEDLSRIPTAPRTDQFRPIAEQIARHSTLDVRGDVAYLGRDTRDLTARVEESGFAKPAEQPRGSDKDRVISEEVYPQQEGESEADYTARLQNMRTEARRDQYGD